MKIFTHFYEHSPLPASGKTVSGCLLKVEFGVSATGYADLHPWAEFGDESLEEQLGMLSAGHLTRITEKSLFFAREDARARRRNYSLLHGLDLPTSHALVHDLAGLRDARERGYRHFKIKVNGDLSLIAAMADAVPDAVFRLDFGGQGSSHDFLRSWNTLDGAIRGRVELIEDPWSDDVTVSERRFFSDWIENPAWPGKVMKPAREFSVFEYQSQRRERVMFTHSLDHPLGQVAALWEASRFYLRFPSLREVGGFSETSPIGDFRIRRRGPRLLPPPGTGFGFDSQLRSLAWEPL